MMSLVIICGIGLILLVAWLLFKPKPPKCENQREIPFMERYETAVEAFEARTGLKEGAHVRYKGFNGAASKYYNSDPDELLDSETIYEIESIVMGRSFTIVRLVGLRGKEFNGIIFKPIDKNEVKNCLKAGGYVRFIGETGGVLDYEAIYEVEHVERDPHLCGETLIKLVGFDGFFNRGLFEKVENQTHTNIH